MPGVLISGSIVEHTWDALPVVATYLGEDCPPFPDISQIPFKGLQRYRELGLHKKARPYQPAAISFVASRAYGFLADSCRSGKTFDAIAAAVLCDARKVLVSTVESVKRVWAEEIVKITGEEAAILYGRAADEVRVFCKTCMGRGFVEEIQNKEEIEKAALSKRRKKPVHKDHRCPDCRAANGQALGMRIFTGKESVHDVLASSRWIVTNPDLLIAQKSKTLPGVEYVDMTLPGWCPTLAGHKLEWILLDESHLGFRGWTRGKENSHISKRDRVYQLSEDVERVFCITATPQVGFPRDWFGQLDIISKGMWGSDSDSRMPWSFASRYCCGGKDPETGFWQWDGKSELADTELLARLHPLKIQRGIEEIAPDMPPVTRQVIRIDVNVAKADRIRRKDETTASTYKRLIRRAGDLKRPVVLENVLNELSAGMKSVVFVKCEESVEMFHARLNEEMLKRQWAPRMRQVRADVWAIHGQYSSGRSANPDKPLRGGNEKMRNEAARMFREHQGAACFIATVDAFQVGLSLKGATTIHALELHESPGCQFQAECRPREIGTRGLTVIYYVAVGTIDDRLEVTLLPKIAMLEAMRQDKSAGDTLQAFGIGKHDDSIDLDKILADLCTRENY